jgi:hypothetical protein
MYTFVKCCEEWNGRILVIYCLLFFMYLSMLRKIFLTGSVEKVHFRECSFTGEAS